MAKKGKFIHIVFTRFNIKMKLDASKYHVGISGYPVLSEHWMKERVNIFRKFCLPSISNQTNNNFEWFVYLDTNTSMYYKKVFATLREKYKYFHPKYVSDEQAMFENLKSYIQKHRGTDVKYVITARIDNDDCLHKNAIDIMQKNFNNQKCEVFHFRNGYTLAIYPKKLFTRYADSIYPPFYFAVEEISPDCDFKMIRQDLLSIRRKTAVTQISDGYYWMQVVHGKNLANEVRGLPYFNKKVLADFGVEPMKIKLSILDCLVYILTKIKQKIFCP